MNDYPDDTNVKDIETLAVRPWTAAPRPANAADNWRDGGSHQGEDQQGIPPLPAAPASKSSELGAACREHAMRPPGYPADDAGGAARS